MTLLPELLKKANYRTSAIGKWHLGARSAANLPIQRGFDQHFGFLKGGGQDIAAITLMCVSGEDHYTQGSSETGEGKIVDLWRDHGPAFGENGTFSGYLYGREAVNVIQNHAANYSSQPLFMYLAWHLVHAPVSLCARLVVYSTCTA